MGAIEGAINVGFRTVRAGLMTSILGALITSRVATSAPEFLTKESLMQASKVFGTGLVGSELTTI